MGQSALIDMIYAYHLYLQKWKSPIVYSTNSNCKPPATAMSRQCRNNRSSLCPKAEIELPHPLSLLVPRGVVWQRRRIQRRICIDAPSRHAAVYPELQLRTARTVDVSFSHGGVANNRHTQHVRRAGIPPRSMRVSREFRSIACRHRK